MSTEWSFGTVPVSAGGGTESSGASMPGVEMERGVLESSVSSAPSCDSRSQRATAADGGELSSPGTRDQTGSSAITRAQGCQRLEISTPKFWSRSRSHEVVTTRKEGSVLDDFCDILVCLFVFVCHSNISGMTERICAKFTATTCLVPRSNEFECQGQRSRSQGQKGA